MSQWLQRGLAKPADKHKTNFLQERQMVPVAELVLKELLCESMLEDRPLSAERLCWRQLPLLSRRSILAAYAAY